MCFFSLRAPIRCWMTAQSEILMTAATGENIIAECIRNIIKAYNIYLKHAHRLLAAVKGSLHAFILLPLVYILTPQWREKWYPNH